MAGGGCKKLLHCLGSSSSSCQAEGWCRRSPPRPRRCLGAPGVRCSTTTTAEGVLVHTSTGVVLAVLCCVSGPNRGCVRVSGCWGSHASWRDSRQLATLVSNCLGSWRADGARTGQQLGLDAAVGSMSMCLEARHVKVLFMSSCACCHHLA